ncbi:MAG: general secretion pathway protein GspE [Mesoaciditoga sp.]|nr:MAG: general secretion pathway protein GspE [Mesoaciditoga sp.]PMP79690.1 MAG: general secretion pathway protein GspE [Mesoaciditoga sp.]HEU24356.1 type II/IV secretion system protein [Mesoaciditoga lauensis]
MATPYKKIGEILVSMGYITQQTLDKALEISQKSGKMFGEVLVENHFVTWNDIADALAAQYNLPRIQDLPSNIPADVINLIPKNLIDTYRIIPYRKDGNNLWLATDNVLNYTQIVREVRFLTNLYPKIAVISKDIYDTVYQYIFGSQVDTSEIISNVETAKEEEVKEEFVESEEAPAVKLAKTLVENGIVQNASDIHIEPTHQGVNVRYRVDGVLRKVTSYPKSMHASVISRIKIMSGLDIAEKRVPQDGKFFMKYLNDQYDFRVSTMPTIYGEKAVLRILKVSSSEQKVSDLGFSEYNLKRFRELINYPYGIILLTGPTGSGKSTTLVAAINEIKDVSKNIVTIEDPVEYNIEGVNQCQVNVEAGLTYPRFLRSVLRQDPDIIMIGEIRDKETAQLAVEASMTGHLVLSTLHTNDAPSAISRLINLGIDPHMLGVALIGVVGQRLVRKLCNDCKVETKVNEDVLKVAKIFYPEIKPVMYQAVGCRNCNEGYKGRTAINEVMIVTSKLRELIYQGASDNELREAAIRDGMRTMFEDGVEKILRGITSYEEVNRVVRSA